MGAKLNPQVGVTLTPAQQAAVEQAFAHIPESERPSLAEMLRELIAGGLSLYQIPWPPDVKVGWVKGRRRK